MATLVKDAKTLDRVREIFDLSEHELADLFGVQRQSMSAWREHGVPATRRATLERLNDLVRVFAREIIRSRIPEIVRTKDAWLNDRTILETIRTDGPEAIYSYLSRLFSYRNT
jgi:predicted transcriptional regulator